MFRCRTGASRAKWPHWLVRTCEIFVLLGRGGHRVCGHDCGDGQRHRISLEVFGHWIVEFGLGGTADDITEWRLEHGVEGVVNRTRAALGLDTALPAIDSPRHDTPSEEESARQSHRARQAARRRALHGLPCGGHCRCTAAEAAREAWETSARPVGSGWGSESACAVNAPENGTPTIDKFWEKPVNTQVEVDWEARLQPEQWGGFCRSRLRPLSTQRTNAWSAWRWGR